jgi:hypothetical protein
MTSAISTPRRRTRSKPANRQATNRQSRDQRHRIIKGGVKPRGRLKTGDLTLRPFAARPDVG